MKNTTSTYQPLNLDRSSFFQHLLIGRTVSVKLRPINYDDVISFRKFVYDENIWKYFAHKIQNSHDMDNYVEEAIAQRNAGLRYHFAVECQKTGEIIGSTALGNYSQKDSRIEIGWSWLESKAQGKNINQHVKFLLLNLAFDHLDIERVEFKTDNLNLRAKKALVKIGASEEGILRKHTLMPDGRRRNTVYYSILKCEWETKIKSEYFSDHLGKNRLVDSDYQWSSEELKIHSAVSKY